MGICSEAGVEVKIKVTNTYVKNGTTNYHIAIGTVTTDPMGGQFSWSPDFELYGFGGNATWKVEVWIVSNPQVIDTHSGDVNLPEPPMP